MRILFLILFFFPIIAYAQITKPGVQAENGGSVLGRALSVNCDGSCILCTLTGTTMNITFSSSCGGGGSCSSLLLQSGGYFLLQNGGKMNLQSCSGLNSYLLLQSGGHLLLQNGGLLIL